MKTLIVYYSRSGQTRLVAESLAKLSGADLEEINDPTDRAGAKGYLKSGKEAFLKKLPPIEPIKKDLKDYDLVLVGTPVWAFTISSPVRAFLEKYKNDLNSWALFCTQGGEGRQKTKEGAEKIISKPSRGFLYLTAKDLKMGISEKAISDFYHSLSS